MIYNKWDVVVVPFPFTEGPGAKRRPALVISNMEFNRSGHTVLAMITTKGHVPWPGDTEIDDYFKAGLNLPCLVRLKLFTLDNRLLLKKIGGLGGSDSKQVKKNLHQYFS